MALLHDSSTAPVRRRVQRCLWVLGVLALAAVLARAFLFDVYRVDSGSMEPFLHGDQDEGEHVLVLYRSRPRLERFDPLVILLPGESEPVVKRVAGLPGESVQVVGGDLVIDGHRLAGDLARPAPVPLFDQRVQELDSMFQLSSDRWRQEGEVWHLDARGLGPPVEAVAVWTAKLLDGRLDADGQRHPGSHDIADAQLELELKLRTGAGFFFATLTEEADKFTLELRPGAGVVHAQLLRSAGSPPAEVLAEAEVALPPEGWLRVRLANVDNTLQVDLGDRRSALTASYAHNTTLESPRDRGYRHLRPRVSFGAADLDLDLRAVRLSRDLHYTERGTHGIDTPLRLGPEELFVLGDNSSESLDSREYGPVPLSAVLGLPLAVVWPPSAWRRLRGTAAQP